MSCFEKLSAAERAAVAQYARTHWEKTVSLSPPSFISANAKADPEGWRQRLCELIAADPKRVRSILQSLQRGFTLIEMSIVLVVIGLIAGGMLVGKDLVRAATLRAEITQLTQFETAVRTFQGKYNAVPGDMANADSVIPDVTAGHNGNGDGVI